MLTCLAFAAALTAQTPVSGPASLPDLAHEVLTDAQALNARTVVDAEFTAALEDFSTDAMALSDALRAAGVTQDMPCIFRGISEDARARLADFGAAQTDAHRTEALTALHVLLDDAILLAPMAEAEARRAQEATAAPAN